MKTYLVGGAVRDMIMGIEPNDKDYVIVGATQKDIENLEKKGFKKVGKDFPIFLHPETQEEYALARTSRKEGYRFDSTISLEEDLKRRDLTINSIAYDLEKKEFIDPFNGIDDIKNKILRNTSEYFKEDLLRILRVARFKCQFPEFTIHESLRDIIMFLSVTKNEFDEIPKERIIRELEKTWKCKKPSDFFYHLDDIDCLSDFFPLLANLRGVIQSEKYHPEGDAFIHTMLVYDHILKLTDDKDCIYACLLHDLGKALTPKDELPKHIKHEKRGVSLVELFCKKYKFSKERKSFVSLFTLNHIRIHDCLNMKPKKIVSLLEDLGIVNRSDNSLDKLNKMIVCAKADSYGKLNEVYPQEEFLLECYNEIFKVDRKEILNDLKSRKKKHLLNKKFYDKKVSFLKRFLKRRK